MDVRAEVTPQGGGILGLLGILFIGLKLTGTIDRSWWWVLAPFWGPLALLLAFMLVVGIIVAIIALVSR